MNDALPDESCLALKAPKTEEEKEEVADSLVRPTNLIQHVQTQIVCWGYQSWKRVKDVVL